VAGRPGDGGSPVRAIQGPAAIPPRPRDPAVRAADRLRGGAPDRVGPRPPGRPAPNLICDNRDTNVRRAESAPSR
jgi:hypothetical protein